MPTTATDGTPSAQTARIKDASAARASAAPEEARSIGSAYAKAENARNFNWLCYALTWHRNPLTFKRF